MKLQPPTIISFHGNKPYFGIMFNIPQIPWIRNTELIRRNSGNICISNIFHFSRHYLPMSKNWFWILKVKCQSLWVLVSHDPSFYFPNKIVSWFNLLLMLQMQDRVQFWEMVIQLFIWYVLVIRSFLNFPLILRICSAE